MVYHKHMFFHLKIALKFVCQYASLISPKFWGNFNPEVGLLAIDNSYFFHLCLFSDLGKHHFFSCHTK